LVDFGSDTTDAAAVLHENKDALLTKETPVELSRAISELIL
jgi:hypothetical protein